MKALRILFRSISESFKSVGRNLSLSIASISCITITLVLVGLSIILSYNVNSFTSDIESDVTIIVFIEKSATSEEVSEVKKEIEKIDNVESIEFESKEQVKKDMQKESEVFDSILESYNEETNPLQDTYLVKVKNIDSIGETANKIKTINHVAIAKYGEGMVEELVKIFDIVKNATIIVVISLILVTAFLISNTIKITISSRKREIEIMRLCGASNTYIKLPFFFEGMFLGFIGSIAPIAICCFGYIYLYEKLGGILFTAIIKLVVPKLIIFDVIGCILIVGVVVGAIGSYRAVRRYLKV